MSRILRFFALVAVVLFSVNAFADTPYGSCSVKKVYTDCADEGYVVQNGECVPKSSGSCSARQYWNGSACTSCPDSHPNSAAGASSESECYKTAELMKNGGSGTCFGKTGTLDGTITCYYGSSCALPSWNSSFCNMTNGSKIFKGWSSSDNATTGTTEDFENGQTYYAVWVTPSCNITNGSGTATTALNNQPRCNVTCNSGYGTSGTYTGSAGATSVSYTCTITSNTCSAGQYWNGSACKECTSGYYCPGGTWTGTGVQGRNSCPAGYGNSEPGSVDESDCYLTTTAGKYVATPKSAETTCAENGYCPGGIVVPYGDTDGRMACTANSSSDAGSDEISDCKCNAGYGGNAGVTGGTCTICAAGTYKTSSGNSSCSTCTEGYYCTGGTNQRTCPTGYEDSAPGSDAAADCYMVVEAGKYLKEPYDMSPYECARGSSSGQHEVYYGSVSQCSSCAPGSYTPYDGAACSTCPAGSYCTGDGNATRCPALYPNSSAGSDAATDCYTNTLTGQYIATPRAEAVTDCQAGTSAGAHTVYYGETSQCNVCKANQWSGDAAGSCQTCPSGWTNDGATAADHAYISSCKHTVAAGNWYNSDNSTFDTCATGTYSEKHLAGYGVSTSCESCNTGYTNNSNHTACVAVTYTVQYNANGGSGTTASSTHTYGVAKRLTANGFTRTGYTFAGWATSASGAVVYTNQQSVTNLASTQGATVNLYAKWTGNHYFINLNPSPFSTRGTQYLYTIYGTNVYLDSNRSQAMTTSANNITKPTRDGYTFGGYYSGSGGTGTEYINANGYITSAGLSAGKECTSCTWYAKWTAIPYTVSFNANGGTGGQTADVTATYGSTLPTISTTAPTRPGYTFDGWYDAPTGGTQYYGTAGNSVRTWDKTANATLYAQWTAGNYYIYLNSSGYSTLGTYTLYTTYGTNVYLDSSRSQAMTTSANPITKPTKTGYTFGGYYSESGGTGTQYIDANGYITSAGLSAGKECASVSDCTWYVKWIPNCYQITLDNTTNGGSGGTTVLYKLYNSTLWYSDSSCSTQVTTITKPTKTNAVYRSHYTGASSGTQYIDGSGTLLSKTVTGPITLYALYNCDTNWGGSGTTISGTCTGTKSTVSFDANGGTGGQTASVTATYGSQMPTISTTKPTRTGYTFDGWYDVLETQYYTAAGASARDWDKTANTTLYARWTANTYTVSFNANGGTGGQTASVTATYDSQMPTISTTAPTRTGYTFNGWYDAQTGGNRYYYSTGASARTWDKTANTTLYAHWTAKTYTCSSGQYLNVTSCTTCTAGYYCPSSSATYTYNGSVQGRTPCGGGKYSSAGATSCSNITAGCYGTSASSSCPAVCAANTYSNEGASSCSSCPTGYKNSGDTAASHAGSASCIISVAGGKYVGTANSATLSTCAGGTYKAAHSVAYGSTSSCETCGAGYYCPAGSDTQRLCADLGGGLYSSSVAGSDATNDCYATVPATKYLSSSTSTSFTTCTAGYYCPGKTLYYASTGGRTACGAGKYSEAGSDASSDCKLISAGCYGTSASSSCPAVCAANTYSDAGASACTSCDSDYANSGTDAASHAGVASCKVTCAAGTYVASANAACTDVGSGYYTTASQTISQGSIGSRSACSSLNAFYTASDSGRNATTDCYGTTSSGKYVSTAKSGEVTCAAGGYCAGSVKVYYNSTGGRTACGAGKYNASTGSSASSACTNITAGCYGTSASSSCPAVCAANTYSNAGASSCSSCPTGYKNSGDTAASHAGSASCIITVSGGYYIGAAGDNSSNWDKCACGTYKASHTVAYGGTSSCATTDSGYYAAAGASSQTKATAGYYAAAGACSQTACSGRTKYSAAGAESCSTVSTGYYTTGCNSSSNACTSQTICAKGTYCSSGVAYDCPGGTYGSTTGLSTNACSGKCTAGYYCPAGSTSATQNACATNATSAAGSDAISDCVCKAGYSGDASTSSGTCTACACGYYKGSTGNTSCTKTTAGYYAAGTGNTGQTKATAGNYAAAGACNQSSCADLGGGLYSSSAAGSDAASDCYATVPATKYLSSSTSTSFTTCTAGYYCPGKTLYYASTDGRTACGGGKYSEAGSDASSDCKTISAGCYGASASSACPNTCAPGSYSTGGASGCTICGNKPANSSYTDARGNTSADCPWTCNDGYNQTSDNQCGQFCTAGITHIKSSNGLSVPLYSSARTSPAINVKVNDSVCYGSRATGQSSGALNVRVGSTTYHSIN